MLSIGKAAKILNVSIDTLRNWEEKGKLIPLKTEAGHRRYAEEQIDKIQMDILSKKTYKSAVLHIKTGIVKKKGFQLNELEARFVFEAQMWIRQNFTSPIHMANDLDYTFAILEDRTILGCLVHHEVLTDKGPGTWILTAYVSPEYRRKNILKSMLSTFTQRLEMGVDRDNTGMRQAIDKLGFKATSVTYERETNSTAS